MSLLSLDIDGEQLQKLALDFAADEKLVEKALLSTLNKMGKWLRARSVRGLSVELKLPQKVVRRRLKSFRVQKLPNGAQVRVFYGLDNVGLIYLNAAQNGRGVSAYGGRFVQSAFIRPGQNSGSQQVFKRQGSARLPIEKQVAAIKDPADQYIEDELLGTEAFERQFYKTFEHELSWRTKTQK